MDEYAVAAGTKAIERPALERQLLVRLRGGGLQCSANTRELAGQHGERCWAAGLRRCVIRPGVADAGTHTDEIDVADEHSVLGDRAGPTASAVGGGSLVLPQQGFGRGMGTPISTIDATRRPKSLDDSSFRIRSASTSCGSSGDGADEFLDRGVN